MISWMFISLVVTILLTPGPTNTLLAASGLRMGVRDSLVLIPAEAFGYLVAISAWGFLIDFIAQAVPILPVMIKLLSASYIIYLAIKLWRTAKQDHDLHISIIYPKALTVATLLNPKGLLFASAIFPATVWLNWGSYLSHMLTFLVLIVPIAFFWICLGHSLGKHKFYWLTPCNMQRTASLILMSFSVPVSYSAVAKFIVMT
ncbi:LysE family translocator [Acinetobacter sp. MD2]|uniref:LysE family translocator n=1 Tax=Acinetobacter sp. MD2 TaxID=2600066 RepID=UPI002D1F0676|nr:LysE family transporter [Acinetobacter sp. MD2]MEB3767467.1 LysE family transporter [Acinetobacter sp. MD2]